MLARHNYWEGNTFYTGKPRPHHLQPITGYLGNKLIKVLTGQCGVGKSILMRQLAAYLLTSGVSSRNLLYIPRCFTDGALTDGSISLATLLQHYHNEVKPVGKIYLFIEEVEAVPHWRHFVYSQSSDSINSCELFISSSLTTVCQHPADSPLQRSCVYFPITPYSYAEYLTHGNHESGAISYRNYLQHGSLPRLYRCPNLAEQAEYLASLKHTIFFRDIVCHYRIKDPVLLEQLFLYLLSHPAQPLSVNTLVAHFSTTPHKSTYETISNYLLYLEQTSLFHRVERMQIKTKERISGSSLFYLNCPSWYSALYPCFAPHVDILLRNQVYLTLRAAGYTVHTGIYRSHTIHFMARRHDRLIYLQCLPTLTDLVTARSHYHSLSAIPDNYEKWIISLDTEAAPSHEGIRNIQAWRLAEQL